ncbi:unnamed protein product [Peronospora destructor]|uniref:PhoD-like phosphatase metallophosphatase domain-containing protein n=1 Tax=Peronospora destructor TaxID=86335 RepID=A0AAV0TGH6_9STRA|nr:unnamed protein product [Peronospora destructor]
MVSVVEGREQTQERSLEELATTAYPALLVIEKELEGLWQLTKLPALVLYKDPPKENLYTGKLYRDAMTLDIATLKNPKAQKDIEARDSDRVDDEETLVLLLSKQKHASLMHRALAADFNDQGLSFVFLNKEEKGTEEMRKMLFVEELPVFEEIKKENALVFLHTGDLHYHNLAVNNVAAFRDGYDSIFVSPAGKAMLAMDVPFVYMWDDHDFGPDNSDSTAPGRNASVQAYREFVPHYPLIGGSSRTNTVHQAFTIGRVRYILTDLRSARTPNTAPATPTKTVLGKKQKAWFKSELVRATSDPDIRLVIWVNTMPWLDDERKWGHFGHEQQELVNFIKGNGLNKWVPIVIVNGDAHMLAVDDGSHSPGNLTVLHAAALGRPGSIKGGPYSHGAFPGPGQYAVMDVTDEGGKDGRVCLYYRGMNIYKGMLIEFDTCHPERTPPVTPYYPPPILVRIMMRIFKKAKRYTSFMALAVVAVIALLVYKSRRQHAINTKKHS